MTTTAKKYNAIVNRIDTIPLSDIIGTDAVNIKKLVISVAKSVLSLSFDDVKLNENDKKNITAFLDNVADSVSKFCDFLDYDNNGKVELVRKDSKGNITYGNDISAVIADGKDVINPILDGGKKVPVIILNTMTNILNLMNNENIAAAKNDFELFKASCEVTFASFALLKKINHVKLFEEKSDDIMRFIISLCIIIVPLIELTSEKHVKGETSVTADEIHKYVSEYYGANVNDLLAVVENIVSAFVKIVGATSVGKSIKGFFKNLCCTSKDAIDATD